ncbi:MarR family winged helix-turn-helix transcriptional regulator [Ectobacillus polymachus]|uniref:MarR family winged helix-turn-helix transcriptional regulator n=1 Tax=Ectobacillus polymachus TaxID=1508806 RepID=UPI003A84F3F8
MERNQYFKAESLSYLILATQRHGNRVLNEILKNVGLTTSKAEVLRVIHEEEKVSLKELGRLLICESGSPSRLVERMVQDDLIEKIVDKKDSRYVVLQLTPVGKEKAKLVRDIEQQLYDQIIQNYSEEELELMCKLLFRFIKDHPFSETLIKRGYTM